jgi:endonuclease-3
MNSSQAIKQLNYLKDLISKNSDQPRLAAEGWDEDWKILIAIILSAQTRDSKTIPVAEELFAKYNSPEKLGRAPLKEIEKIIRSLNYFRTKSKNIKATAEIIGKGGVPSEFEKLIELPGVGRKTANVFLVEAKNAPAIGVDTHVARLSQKLNWTKNTHPHKIEKDLEKLFPKRYWNSINYILVTFGQTFGRSRKTEDKILEEVRTV